MYEHVLNFLALAIYVSSPFLPLFGVCVCVRVRRQVVRARYRASLLLSPSDVPSARTTVTPWVRSLDPTTCLWPDVDYKDENR